MKFFTEPEKNIPIVLETDVLVAGGGPAGFAAAIAAGRQGARVTLIEQSGAIGGVATIGLMSHWTGRVTSGIYTEILERAWAKNDKDVCTKQDAPIITIDPDLLKLTMLEMLEEANVNLQLYTFVSGVIMEDNIVKGIITESKSGREVMLGKIIVDATGDGDIAYKAEVPFIKGRESDGKMQPMTLMFKVGGVDYERAVFLGGFESKHHTERGEIQELGKQHIPHPGGHVLLYKSTIPGVVTCNMTNCINVDGTSPVDLTAAEVQCRKQIPKIIDFLREYVPGYENCYLLNAASTIGVRETRHFEGEYCLTEEDILTARIFDDWVVTDAHFNFDVHNVTGAGLDETGAQAKFPQRKGYTIPYGCFVPKKVDNLFLAGRCISGTHIAHSNFRVMPICVGMGHAVGIAATLCSKHDILPRNLDVKHIQEILLSQGCSVL